MHAWLIFLKKLSPVLTYLFCLANDTDHIPCDNNSNYVRLQKCKKTIVSAGTICTEICYGSQCLKHLE